MLTNVLRLVLLLSCSAAVCRAEVLVLYNGNVLEGEVFQQADRYVVESEGSLLRVLRSDVAMIAPTMVDAYRKRVAKIQPRDADAHIELASWCIRNKLLPQARNELALAEQTDVRHPQLTMLRRQLENIHQPRVVQLPAARELSAEERQAAHSIGQLPSGVQRAFVSHVQPLLLNRCGNNACHGPAVANTFHLQNAPWRPLSKHLSDGNLAAVLQQLDPSSPNRSLLLMSAETAHGSLKKAPLSGPHLTMLRRWAHLALGRTYEPAEEAVAPSELLIDDNEVFDELNHDMEIEASVPDAKEVTGIRVQPKGADPLVATASFDQPIAISTPRASTDPFDPEIFNRRQQQRRTKPRAPRAE